MAGKYSDIIKGLAGGGAVKSSGSASQTIRDIASSAGNGLTPNEARTYAYYTDQLDTAAQKGGGILT